jgi:hypothetical protein
VKSLLVDLQYFPTVDYYLTLFKFEHVIFEQYDHHRKMSFRNRCTIAGANGPIKLTVPLIGGRDQRTISKDVKIDNSINWQVQHLRSIISAYNRSPFFDYFSERFLAVFSRKFKFLQDWNLACLSWLRESAGGKWIQSLTENYEAAINNPSVVDFRNRFFPATIQKNNMGNLSYRQVFQEKNGFIPHLSILDLLFCSGPNGVITAADTWSQLDRN